jgi:AcrR family transcriptional regulator
VTSDDASIGGARRWGDESALFDDDEARRRLLDATGRCIVRRGSIQIQMADVAQEAGVSRSTVYRYFQSRNELVLELLIARTDAAFAKIVAGLPAPDDARLTIPELVLAPIGLVDGNPLNEALYSPESRSLVSPSLGPGAEQSVDATYKHFAPLFERWHATGQVHADLDIRETVRWINAMTVLLLTPPWNAMALDERVAFVERYLVRALVVS